MSHVLGAIIKSTWKAYNSLSSHPANSLSTPWSYENLYSIKRYPWDEFMEFMDQLTLQLTASRHSISELQEQVVPMLFRTQLYPRLTRVFFSPFSFIKLIDTWSSTLFFAAPQSQVIKLSAHQFQLEILLSQEFRGGLCFFQHCLAGLQLSLMHSGFTRTEIIEQTIHAYGITVTFDTRAEKKVKKITPTQAERLGSLLARVEVLRAISNERNSFPLRSDWQQFLHEFEVLSRQFPESYYEISSCLMALSVSFGLRQKHLHLGNEAGIASTQDLWDSTMVELESIVTLLSVPTQ